MPVARDATVGKALITPTVLYLYVVQKLGPFLQNPNQIPKSLSGAGPSINHKIRFLRKANHPKAGKIIVVCASFQAWLGRFTHTA